MKKVYLLMAAAAIVAFASCNKNNGGSKTNDPSEEPEQALVLEDFENGGILQWTGSNGCDFTIVDNPSKTGVNTSDKVGCYKTADAEWDFVWSSGFGDKDITFENDKYTPLNFSKDGYVVKIQCYAPAAGVPVFCKLEGIDVDAIEINNVVTKKANEWEELVFDFEPYNIVDGAYKNFVICADAGGTTPDQLFYFDNIRLVK